MVLVADIKKELEAKKAAAAKKASESGKTSGKSSNAPVSSNMPDIALEGIEKVERQVRHHLELARMCEKEGYKGQKFSKGRSVYENFKSTLKFAAEKNLITPR